MKNLQEIQKYIGANKKLGFDGYQSIKQYLSEFNMAELDYIEVSFTLGKESAERLMQFRDVIPLTMAIFAAIIALIPDNMKENLAFFPNLLGQFLIIFCGALLIYLFLNNYPSKKIDTCRTALEVIKKIKVERNA